jgi:hypothetical protein
LAYVLTNRPSHTPNYAPALDFAKHAPIQQIVEVAHRSVGQAIDHGRPFAAGELALKAVQQAVFKARSVPDDFICSIH